MEMRLSRQEYVSPVSEEIEIGVFGVLCVSGDATEGYLLDEGSGTDFGK